MRSAAAATGLAMTGLAAFLAPGIVRAAAIVGVLAVLLSLRPGLRWPAAITAACVAALMTAASDRGGLAEGLLVLGYLLIVDSIERPRAGLRPATVAAALGGSGVVALALTLPPTPRPYLVLTGLGAIAGGYALAVPRGLRRGRSRRRARR
jgi:hypothetical protein